MDALYAKIPLVLPNSLVDEEIEQLMKPYHETAQRQKIKTEDLKLPREMFEEQAKRRVSLGLLLGEIIQTNNITLDNDKVRAKIEALSQSYERPEDVITWYYADKSRLADVQQLVLEDQTVDWLLAQANITDEVVNFNDVMEKQAR